MHGHTFDKKVLLAPPCEFASLSVIKSKQVLKSDFIFQSKGIVFLSFCKRLKPEGGGDKIPEKEVDLIRQFPKQI